MRVGVDTKIWHPDKSVILVCQIGARCVIHAPVWIGDAVIIGNDCKIQSFAFIPTGVELGDNVFIGPHVCFTNDLMPPSFGKAWKKTLVKRGAVIGANATILPGITIGEYAFIGAGSVVTSDVPDAITVVGNPAKNILRRKLTPDQMDPYHPDVNKCPVHAEGGEGIGYACSCKPPCPVHADHLVDTAVHGTRCTCRK